LKIAEVLAGCLFLLPLAGTSPSVLRNTAEIPHHSQAYPPSERPFDTKLGAARSLFAAGRYGDAVESFHTLANEALAAGNPDLAAVATGDAGGCQFALHQYRSALASFLEARSLAELAGDPSRAAAEDANIASLYSEMGELESAVRWMESSLEHISGRQRSQYLPQLQMQMAVLRAQQGRMAEAEQLFRQGIEGADAAGELELYAQGCNRMGEAFLLNGKPTQAEPALLEAFRVRKLHHLPLDTSYHRLGRLRLAQGDLASASNLLDRAVELAVHAQNQMPTWDIYYSRGLVRMEQGRLRGALDDLRVAVRLASAWRWSAPAAEAARISAESKLDQVYSALIEAAGRRYLDTANPALARETFAAAEENHAASLRSLLSTGGASKDLPPAYREALATLERAEAAALRSPAAGGQEVRRARAELARQEASAAPARESVPAAPPGNLAARVQAALAADAVLFSFHLGDRDSWLWTVDRAGIALHRLPPRAEIGAQGERLSRAIREDSPAAAAAGSRLFATLFGQVPPRFTHHRRWLLSLDQALFDVPMAALVEDHGARPAYVAERHIIQVIPGALLWLESAPWPRRAAAPLFLGIGDAIYNSADSRWRAPLPSRPGFRWSLFAADRTGADASLELPRLVASAPELAACARAWRGEHTLLEGVQASGSRLVEELRRNPAVIHFAAHFVASAESSPHLVFDGSQARSQPGAIGLIALSLNQAGETELLTAPAIAQWTVRAELVTLSGCHSAAGAALPGAGLLGLTRAWLAAGARSVVGSLWDTPDESGELFAALYRNLSAQRSVDPALALDSAQREMIHSGGWMAQPRYWGAYFVVANE
jgi:CHAT domain-containing protein